MILSQLTFYSIDFMRPRATCQRWIRCRRIRINLWFRCNLPLSSCFTDVSVLILFCNPLLVGLFSFFTTARESYGPESFSFWLITTCTTLLSLVSLTKLQYQSLYIRDIMHHNLVCSDIFWWRHGQSSISSRLHAELAATSISASSRILCHTWAHVVVDFVTYSRRSVVIGSWNVSGETCL